jgi:hypothetical protein
MMIFIIIIASAIKNLLVKNFQVKKKALTIINIIQNVLASISRVLVIGQAEPEVVLFTANLEVLVSSHK